ncbi:MAG: GyrI-like domain-containing protein [Nocardiopsaceae bacterium]|jgi:hypothetical protein|nr:GyrI-like domain-containing protein [Nocardiopsaceae bacterium]
MDVLVREVPEQTVITEQRMVDQAALQEWLPGAMSRVLKAAGEAAAGTTEQPYLQRDDVADEPVFIVIYEGNPNEGETAVETCTPLRAGVPAPADTDSRVIPAHREAYVRVAKATVVSGHIGDVYIAVERWIGSNGLDIAAAPRETYWTDFHSASGNDVVFDVAFPVR